MPAHSWAFVASGYLLTGVVLSAYTLRLFQRLRRARRRIQVVSRDRR